MTGIAEAIIEIRKEQDGGYPKVKINDGNINEITWYDDNPTSITNEQIVAKQAELQTAYDAKEYQRDRVKVYPEIGDQLDMIYHDQTDGTTTFKDAIKAIKDAHPKP